MLVPSGNGYGPADPQLRPLVLDDEAPRRAKRWVYAQAARGLDVNDPGQARQAAAIAEPVLNMLGLHGDDTWRPSPTAARYQGAARFIHGTAVGVKLHRAAHKPLCRPCRRWVEVDARKRSGVVFMRPPLAGLIGLCGTHRRWQGHLADGEALDPACAMYAQWFDAQLRHRGDYTGPLAAHAIDAPLPLHFDGTPCAHKVDRHGASLEDGCTGRAGWLLACACGFEQPMATQLGFHHMQGEHRRQVILRHLAEAN